VTHDLRERVRDRWLTWWRAYGCGPHALRLAYANIILDEIPEYASDDPDLADFARALASRFVAPINPATTIGVIQ
jgi:hypothetical protein